MNVSEALIREIVSKVLEEAAGKTGPGFVKQVDPSGIIGIKTSSKENPFMYWLRSCYYKLIRRLFDDGAYIVHFAGGYWNTHLYRKCMKHLWR